MMRSNRADKSSWKTVSVEKGEGDGKEEQEGEGLRGSLNAERLQKNKKGRK